MPENPFASEAYRKSVAEQTEHHRASKTFSGSLLVPHLPRLLELAASYRCETALDYGCGKGVQYRELIRLRQGPHSLETGTFEELLHFPVTKWDPCVPEFMEPPRGRFDLVIVSHVLFWIPLEDLKAWVLPSLAATARKALFVVETIGDEKKRILSDRDAHPRGLHALDWIDLLLPFVRQNPNLTTHLVTEYRSGVDGRIYAGEWKL